MDVTGTRHRQVENPDIFTDLEVPAKLTPYVRRIISAQSEQDLDFQFNVRATGYCYLGWVWRGNWAGSVAGDPVFDTSQGGPLFCSGQVLDRPILGRMSGQPKVIFVEFQAVGMYQLLGIPGAGLIELAVPPQVFNPQLKAALSPLGTAAPELSFDTGVALLLSVLDKLAKTATVVPKEFSDAISQIERTNGAVKLG